MCTRFQRHVDSGILQQWFIFGPYGSKGIHLGMAFTAAHVIAFADDKAPLRLPPRGGGYYDYGPNHRIGFRILHTISGQLQATLHIHLVNLLLIHGAKIRNIREETKQLVNFY